MCLLEACRGLLIFWCVILVRVFFLHWYLCVTMKLSDFGQMLLSLVLCFLILFSSRILYGSINLEVFRTSYWRLGQMASFRVVLSSRWSVPLLCLNKGAANVAKPHTHHLWNCFIDDVSGQWGPSGQLLIKRRGEKNGLDPPLVRN